MLEGMELYEFPELPDAIPFAILVARPSIFPIVELKPLLLLLGAVHVPVDPS